MTLIHFLKGGIATALISLAAAFPANALDLPVTTVNGKDYYYYDVQPKETLFSLSKRLGISREEIINYNPGIDGNLKAYTRLYFPVESGLSTISDGDHITTSHEVKKGETLYGISKKYDISVDRLIELNPSARDGIKSGDILSIQQESTPTKQNGSTRTGSSTHTIAPGETLYRIAVNNGITVEQLLDANPTLDANNYKEGTVLTIPGGNTPAEISTEITEVDVNLQPIEKSPQQPSDTNASEGIADLRANAVEISADSLNENMQAAEEQAEETDEIEATEADEESVPMTELTPATIKPYNIAVMLPFKLDEENTGRDAENFTEFYRGFLLAAKIHSNSGRAVNIQTYDTRGDIDTVKELMALKEMADIDMFVAPASTAELDYIISQIDSDRQFVFNTFAVRNNTYQNNPAVLQANIPHTMLYQRAIDAFMIEMAGRTPIFVQRIGATADKEEFASMLKTQLTEKGVEYKEITYENALKTEDFAEFDNTGKYVIVPLSSSAAEFNKIVPEAKLFKSTLTSADGLTLFGYPEWLTFRGERKESLGFFNATIYSRFYYDENYYPARRVADEYTKFYGRDMNTAVPSQAIMGYDVASYIIQSMRNNDGDFHTEIKPYEGLQTDFIFSDSNSEGLVNTSVELIKFGEGGTIEHRNI